MSPSAMPAPDFGSAISNGANSFMDTFEKYYKLNRQIKSDKQVDDFYGGVAGSGDAQGKIQAVQGAIYENRIKFAEAFNKEYNNKLDQMVYYDENSQPKISPETGQPITMAEASRYADTKGKYESLRKVGQEISNLIESGEILKLDKKRLDYYINNIQPEEREQIKSMIDNYRSQIKVSEAQAKTLYGQFLVFLSQNGLNQALTKKTENHTTYYNACACDFMHVRAIYPLPYR